METELKKKGGELVEVSGVRKVEEWISCKTVKERGGRGCEEVKKVEGQLD